MPARDDLPSTLRRSPQKAQETWAKTHDSAAETYGDGARAHRTAYAALKHGFEKVGDHWEPKERKGPSDAHAAKGFRADSESDTPTAQGVDANASKEHLREVARRLEISGRSTMSKPELVQAIEKENARRTARARGD